MNALLLGFLVFDVAFGFGLAMYIFYQASKSGLSEMPDHYVRFAVATFLLGGAFVSSKTLFLGWLF